MQQKGNARPGWWLMQRPMKNQNTLAKRQDKGNDGYPKKTVYEKRGIPESNR